MLHNRRMQAPAQPEPRFVARPILAARSELFLELTHRTELNFSSRTGHGAHYVRAERNLGRRKGRILVNTAVIKI